MTITQTALRCPTRFRWTGTASHPHEPRAEKLPTIPQSIHHFPFFTHHRSYYHHPRRWPHCPRPHPQPHCSRSTGPPRGVSDPHCVIMAPRLFVICATDSCVLVLVRAYNWGWSRIRHCCRSLCFFFFFLLQLLLRWDGDELSLILWLISLLIFLGRWGLRNGRHDVLVLIFLLDSNACVSWREAKGEDVALCLLRLKLDSPLPATWGTGTRTGRRLDDRLEISCLNLAVLDYLHACVVNECATIVSCVLLLFVLGRSSWMFGYIIGGLECLGANFYSLICAVLLLLNLGCLILLPLILSFRKLVLFYPLSSNQEKAETPCIIWYASMLVSDII